jgi:hypothetical protein
MALVDHATRGGRGPQGRASLDFKTKLGNEHRWQRTSYPECREASVVRVRAEPAERLAVLSVGRRFAEQGRSSLRAQRRAMATSRRFMVRNGLVFMWVLTFEHGLHGPEGYERSKRLVAEFVHERLRAALGGEAFPYWYAPEPHPNKNGNSDESCERSDCPCHGHGWHVNLFIAVPFPHAEMLALWGHGHVWVTDWRKDRWGRRGSQRRVCARRAASYGTKYAAKDFGDDFGEHYVGLHRYERAQGFNPARSVSTHESRRDAFGAAVQEFDGEAPSFVWRSEDCESWAGPPVWWMQWE